MTTGFFRPSRAYTVAEIAELVGASLIDPAASEVVIRGIASALDAGPGDLAYIDGKRNLSWLAGLKASAVLCPREMAEHAPAGVAVLAARKPQQAFASIGRLMYPAATAPAAMTRLPGLSEHAQVSAEAVLEAGVVVEAGAVIGPGVAIGRGTIVAPNAVIGPGCQIGRDAYVGPGASVQNALIGDRVMIHGGAQIGRAGFGFVPGPRGPERIAQIGRVILQDDVEIGANTTVDRGALDDTIIGEGTKIDNLVQIGHNVRIGRNCLMAAHCGLSGSVTVGDHVMLGGRVGIADHIRIGSGAVVTGGSGIQNDIPDGEKWGGYPAQPVRTYFREVAALRALGRRRRPSRDTHE